MSSIVLKRKYDMQLPINYVEVEKNEMEYIDGGANTVEYWWGTATNLSSKECGDMADAFDGEANRYNLIAGLFGAGAWANPVFMGAAGVLNLIAGAQCNEVARALRQGERGSGATLNTNIITQFVTVNVW